MNGADHSDDSMRDAGDICQKEKTVASTRARALFGVLSYDALTFAGAGRWSWMSLRPRASRPFMPFNIDSCQCLALPFHVFHLITTIIIIIIIIGIIIMIILPFNALARSFQAF